MDENSKGTDMEQSKNGEMLKMAYSNGSIQNRQKILESEVLMDIHMDLTELKHG